MKLATKLIVLLLIVVVVLLVGYRFATRSLEEGAASERVPKIAFLQARDLENVRSSIRAVGEVEALSQVELKAKISEQVREVLVSIGDQVSAGDELVLLEEATLSFQLAQTEAELEGARAQLDELLGGTRIEQLRIREAQVELARTSLQDAEQNAFDRLQSSFVVSDNAVRNNVDAFFINPRTQNPTLRFLLPDFALSSNLRDGRRQIEEDLLSWQGPFKNLTPEFSLSPFIEEAEEKLRAVQAFLSTAALAVNSLQASPELPEATVNSYQANVASARTGVSTALASLLDSKEKLRGAEGTLQVMERELSLASAGSTPENVRAQEARVSSAQARVQTLKSQLRDARITSPIQGEVASVSVDPGELVSPGSPVVSVVNPRGLQVRAFLVGKDATLIHEGTPVKVEERFRGVVTRISPRIHPETKKVEVIVALSGVSSSDLFIGSLANLALEISAREDAYYLVPLSAIRVRTEDLVVFGVTADDRVKAHPVEAGRIIGNHIQVRSGISPDMNIIASVRGLSEGDRVEVQHE